MQSDHLAERFFKRGTGQIPVTVKMQRKQKPAMFDLDEIVVRYHATRQRKVSQIPERRNRRFEVGNADSSTIYDDFSHRRRVSLEKFQIKSVCDVHTEFLQNLTVVLDEGNDRGAQGKKIDLPRCSGRIPQRAEAVGDLLMKIFVGRKRNSVRELNRVASTEKENEGVDCLPI